MNAPAPSIRLLVCGSADRGDDGAAVYAVAHFLPRLAADLRQRLEVRRCPQLDAVDLIDVAPGEACIVLDTVVGVAPGEVIEIPLDELVTREGIAPRSSHALPIEQVLGITAAVRGSVPTGMFVGIGGKWFGFGQLQSRALRQGMPAFERAAEAAIGRLAAAVLPEAAAQPEAGAQPEPIVQPQPIVHPAHS